MRASPFNSHPAAIYGGGGFPVGSGMFPIGGALYGGLAPGKDMNDWFDLLQTQKYLSMKRKFHGLTTKEAAIRKAINKLIMQGTAAGNEALKAARKFAATRGQFNYRPPTLSRKYFTPEAVSKLNTLKRNAWLTLGDARISDGTQIAAALSEYKRKRKEIVDDPELVFTQKPDNYVEPDWSLDRAPLVANEAVLGLKVPGLTDIANVKLPDTVSKRVRDAAIAARANELVARFSINGVMTPQQAQAAALAQATAEYDAANGADDMA